MKRPSRPTKRKKPVDHKIVRGLKQAVKHARRSGLTSQIEPMAPEAAAIFDIAKPPAGFAYQWSPAVSTFRMELKGWSRVPFSRHPELGKPLNFDGYIVYHDMALFQISEALVQEALAAVRDKSKSLGWLGKERLSGDYSGGFNIMPEEWVVSETLPDAEPLSEMILNIRFMMPKGWPSGAAACRLELAEYVRRRLMISGHLLAAGDDGTYSIVALTTRKVD